MKIQRIVLVVLVLAGVGVTAPTAVAQTSYVDIEAGYQWLEITGNEDMYRTQINQDEGFVLNDLTIDLVDTEGEISAFDHFRIDAAGFGGSPAGRFRMTADLPGIYSLTFQYHQYDHFSALPGWANPSIDDGVVPGQHTWDRTRDMLDLEIELLPGKAITPILGYRWNRLDGPGTTTYHVGEDEFRLNSDIEETETEFRVGLAFHAGDWRGAVIQGWRDFSSTQRLHLAPGAGFGNNSRPVLGLDINADTLNQSVRSDADTPVTSAYVNGGLGDRVRVSASYVRSEWDGDATTTETVSGGLASYEISRFFASLDQSIASRTTNPTWRGGARIGFDLAPGLVLDLGYETRHRELEGWALISELYLGTTNLSGADPRDVTRLVEIRNGYTRDDDIADVTLRAADLGPFRAWAGWSQTDSSYDVVQDVAEIIYVGGQGGRYDRTVDAYEVGAGFEVGGFKLLVDYHGDDADQPVLRTDYLDRSRVRGRVDWSPCEHFSILGTIENLKAENDDPGIALDADTDHYAVDVDVHPPGQFSLRVAWDAYETETTTLILRPYDFGTEASLHTEDGEMLEGSIAWHGDKASVRAGYSTLENTGTLPFQIDRYFARAAFDFTTQWGAALEYESNEYTEDGFAIANFDAERYGVFLRWHP